MRREVGVIKLTANRRQFSSLGPTRYEGGWDIIALAFASLAKAGDTGAYVLPQENR